MFTEAGLSVCTESGGKTMVCRRCFVGLRPYALRVHFIMVILFFQGRKIRVHYSTYIIIMTYVGPLLFITRYV
jgi:hypothetical protein